MVQPNTRKSFLELFFSLVLFGTKYNLKVYLTMILEHIYNIKRVFRKIKMIRI